VRPGCTYSFAHTSSLGLRINTNVASFGAQRSLSAVTTKLAGSYQRLSSGLRIATAADDASGLGISNRMRSQIRSWGAASRNIQDGISAAQTAEGSLGEVSSILVRMRELLVQGENGTLQAEDRDSLDTEFQALKSELDRLSSDTEFNGISLLSGSPPRIGIVASIDSGSALMVNLTDSSSTGLGIAGTGVGLAFGPPDQLGLLDAAIETVNGARAELGADQNRLESALVTAQQTGESLSAAESRIRDVDMAMETAELTRNGIVQQAATSVLAQANTQPQLALSLIG
jgi:flagellin